MGVVVDTTGVWVAVGGTGGFVAVGKIVGVSRDVGVGVAMGGRGV